MSGIFRHSAPASNNNNSNETTPQKRISFGAFCTNPGALQDVTMDTSYGVGYRSPCVSLQHYHGASSPAVQGRSVREFEEHTAQLRKENFNLKLRLYFVEQNMPALKSNGGDGCDTVIRELIDLKVEAEMLRRECDEKQVVLKDALQAIEVLQNVEKATKTNYEAELDALKQKLQLSELSRHAEKSENNDLLNTMLGHSDIVNEHVNTLQKIRELETLVKTHEDTISELQNKVDFFDSLVEKREKTIQELEEKTEQLEHKNAELQEELDCKKQTASNENCKQESNTLGNSNVNSVQDRHFKEHLENCLQEARDQSKTINNLQVSWNRRQDANENLSAYAKRWLQEFQRLQLEIQQYRAQIADKTCIIDELEEQSEDLRKQLKKALQTMQNMKQNTKPQQEANKETASLEQLESMVNNKPATDTDEQISENFTMQARIEKQENIIKTLKAENKKKTADLQNLVNKELWEKNREIERLTKLVNTRSPSSPLENTKSNVDAIQREHEEYADLIERNKQLEHKIEKLAKRLATERENEQLIAKLRHEIRETRGEVEQAEKLRLECANMCSTLTERLEELAGFLNSLLKNKDIIGLLAADRKRAMRKAVDNSLDLSKSLNRTLSLTGVSFSEHSFSQLCNLSEILNNDSIFAEQQEQQQLDETAAIELNESRRSAIEALKAENKVLKKELDKRRTLETLGSQKDRRSLATSVALTTAMENQSESEAWSEPDRQVANERMGINLSALLSEELSVVGKKNASSDSDVETTDDTAQLNHSRSTKSRSQQQDTIAQLKRFVAQRDERILQVQSRLVEVHNRLKKENLRVLDLTDEVRQLRERNEQLQTDLLAIGAANSSNDKQNNSELAPNESIWLHQIEEQSELLQSIEKERDRLEDEARAATLQLKKLRNLLEQERLQHAEELQTAKSEERKHLDEQRKAAEEMLQKELEAQQAQQKETLEQLTELQRQYIEAQRSIDSHIENAKELRQTLVDSELNARALKKQLDESALQATQAVMERSKALSEKLQLEQSLNDYKALLQDMESARDDLRKRLEASEVALQLANAQRKQVDEHLNGSDISQSGYTSEEVAPLTTRGNISSASTTAAVGSVVVNANSLQRLNNSSPDLGIESDAGRVSSVELTNAHRSLFMKIEVPPPTEAGINVTRNNKDNSKQELSAMKDVDIENQPPNANAAIAATATTTKTGSSIVHDCAKVEEENADLKRKLIRSKRLLEETHKQLTISNQMKAQIERDIKTQIIKTHNVLKNVRSNMDNDK